MFFYRTRPGSLLRVGSAPFEEPEASFDEHEASFEEFEAS